MLSQVAVDVSSRFRFICNRNLLSVHAPHLSAFQALDLPTVKMSADTGPKLSAQKTEVPSRPLVIASCIIFLGDRNGPGVDSNKEGRRREAKGGTLI